ncbi:MAG TPA: S-adenosylmethionine:tRNA ribosyltransferase-isomerase [Acidimicrobiia bacterium]
MTTSATIEFVLPPALEATRPPEARGMERDAVRMMVVDARSGGIEHSSFDAIAGFLSEGDALVVNVSSTVPAALRATDRGGTPLMVHLSVPQPDGLWTVEVRTPAGHGTLPGPSLKPQVLGLDAGGSIELLARRVGSARLWVANLRPSLRLDSYLAAHGGPIRYGASAEPRPLSDYQTVYGIKPGSAEMASAGRPFTRRLLIELIARGVEILPIVLHCGVSSFEQGEAPDRERYRVPPATADAINAVHTRGSRVIAVGTTVVRALETVADGKGRVGPGHGYTDLVVGPDSEVRSVDGLITGWHEPGASHLGMVEAMAGALAARSMYRSALEHGYLWHQFGDSCLILR